MVMALGLYRQQEALKLQRSITDTTNELLVKNSEKLKQNTIEVAKESERGIVDIETLKKANENLIATMKRDAEDSAGRPPETRPGGGELQKIGMR